MTSPYSPTPVPIAARGGTTGHPADTFQGSEAWTRALIDRAGFGVFRCTADGTLVDVNAALATMLGFSDPGALKASGLSDTLWSSREERERCLAELESGARETSHDVQAQRRDGSVLHLRLSVTADRDGRGRVRFVEGIAENITERERREEVQRLRGRVARLRARVEELEEPEGSGDSGGSGRRALPGLRRARAAVRRSRDER